MEHERPRAGAFCVCGLRAVCKVWVVAACLAGLLAGSWLPVGAAPASSLAQAGPPSGLAAQPGPQSAATAVTRKRALQWLHTQQLPDGSFGQMLPGGRAAPNPSATANAVYILALLGEDPGGANWTVGGRSALDGLAALAPDFARADAGQAGLVARAVAAAGRDARAFAGLDLVQIIESFYDPATGRYHPQLLFRDTLAVEGLARAGAAVPAAALDALWQARLPDGGWFWAFDGQESDLDTTGYVMQVLTAYATKAPCAPALLPAAAYLVSHQDPAGGWGASVPAGPPNADSTGLAVGALQAFGYDVGSATGPLARSGRSPLASLLAFQEAGGAFVYIPQPGHEEVRLAATLDALTALVPQDQPGPACRLMYLPVATAR